VVTFLEGVANGGAGGHSAYRPWALQALVVAYGAAGRTAEAAWPAHETVEEAAAVFALASEGGEAGARGTANIALLTQLGKTAGAATVVEPGLSVYPNPSSALGGGATVALTLAAPEEVRVVVYDVLGREVAVLYEGGLAAGTARLSLPVLPSGTYLVRVSGSDGVGNSAATRRVSVVR
jgi:hypothetical protein